MTPKKTPRQFMKGMELSKVVYEEAVRPILDSDFPELTYSAGLLGGGSDVLSETDKYPRLKLMYE